MADDGQLPELTDVEREVYSWQMTVAGFGEEGQRSEEHTSELQSRRNSVCRRLLEKKKDSTGATPT